jgi:hypothetical protein
MKHRKINKTPEEDPEVSIPLRIRMDGDKPMIFKAFIIWYLALLGATMKDLHDLMAKDEKNHYPYGGPDISYLNTALRLQKAPWPLYADTLKALRTLVRRGHKEGVNVDYLPLPLRLDLSPEEYQVFLRQLRDPQTPSQHRFQWLWDVCNEVIETTQTHTLYASVGTGFFLRSIMDFVVQISKPTIESIVVRKMKESFVRDLMSKGFLADNFLHEMRKNMAAIASKRYANSNKPTIIVEEWPGIPPLHGTKFSEDRLQIGFWSWHKDHKLNTSASPVETLTPEDSDFDLYNQLLTTGKAPHCRGIREWCLDEHGHS